MRNKRTTLGMLEFVYEFPREILGVKTPRELFPRGIHDEGHIVVIRRNLACITGLAICHNKPPSKNQFY